jgi:polyisoprenoid-binding protein YceI
MIFRPRKGIVALVLSLAGASLPAFSQETKKAEPHKNFEVDTRASKVYMRVDPDGRGHAHGIVGNLSSGKVILGAEKQAGEWVFDTTSFDADTPAARQYVGLTGTMSDSDRRSINQAMLGTAVLDTQRFPKATFSITSAQPLDSQTAPEPGRYRLEGRLHLHGVEQPVRFEVKVEKKGPSTLGMRGQFTILQTNYGIQPYSALLGFVRVRNDLQVYGDLVLEAK